MLLPTQARDQRDLIQYLFPYLGTVAGGRRGVENGPAGGGALFAPGGGRVLQNCKKSPKNVFFQGMLKTC